MNVAGRRDVVHAGGRVCAENILVVSFLEDPRSAAVEQYGEHLEFFSDCRDGQTVTGGNIAYNGIDAIALNEVSKFGGLFCCSTSFVNVDRRDHSTVNSLAFDRGGKCAVVDSIDYQVRSVLCGNSERP